MFAQGIIGLLILVGFCYLVWKLIIEPRLPNDKDLPEGVQILQEKLDKLNLMREEYEAAIEEKEVTEKMKEIDEEIARVIGEIKNIENA